MADAPVEVDTEERQSTPFGNSSKVFDLSRPFHRIASPDFDETRRKAPISGRGFDCGCRAPGMYDPLTIGDDLAILGLKAGIAAIPAVGQIVTAINEIIAGATGTDLEAELAKLLKHEGEALIFARALRSIPAWVPVDRKGYDKNFKEIQTEVEGRLTRSFQSFRDLPQLQWSKWYKWSFQVEPIDGYRFLLGNGNIRTETEIERINDPNHQGSFGELINSGRTLDSSFNCVWDTGAFSRTPGNRGGGKLGMLPGVMFHEKWPFWPMMGDWFWCRGRLVYDCTHPSTSEFEGPNMGLHPAMMTPLSAIATARFEGMVFEENTPAVPATRFLFFACRKGGYIDLERIGGGDAAADPVFIVDLPDLGSVDDITWAIDHTGEAPGNTLVVRPSLLMKLEHLPFGIPSSEFPEGFKISTLEPKIELVERSNKKAAPRQVKITIPLSKLDASTDACGFVASFGWRDPVGANSSKVKKVTIKFERAHSMQIDGDLRFKFAVNGRHRFFASDGVKNGVAFDVPPFDLLVPQSETVLLSVHAMQRRGFGEHMEKTDRERTLRFGGLIDPGPGAEKIIKDGVELVKLANGQFIRSDTLKHILEVSGDIFSARKDVVWKEHVDAEFPDPKNKHLMASVVSRELFLDPPAIFNKQDQPAGFVDDPSPRNKNFNNGTIIEGQRLDLRLTVSAFLDKGVKDHQLTGTTDEMFVVGDADSLAFKVNDIDGKKPPYVMDIKLTVDHQAEPGNR